MFLLLVFVSLYRLGIAVKNEESRKEGGADKGLKCRARFEER